MNINENILVCVYIYIYIYILRTYRIFLIPVLSWRHEQQTIDHGDINAGID